MTEVHKLKSWPASFELVVAGYKTAEVRLNDRDFQGWDYVLLHKWDPATEDYVGPSLMAQITHVEGVDKRSFWGLKDGYVVLSLRVLSRNYRQEGA